MPYGPKIAWEMPNPYAGTTYDPALQPLPSHAAGGVWTTTGTTLEREPDITKLDITKLVAALEAPRPGNSLVLPPLTDDQRRQVIALKAAAAQAAKDEAQRRITRPLPPPLGSPKPRIPEELVVIVEENLKLAAAVADMAELCVALKERLDLAEERITELEGQRAGMTFLQRVAAEQARIREASAV